MIVSLLIHSRPSSTIGIELLTIILPCSTNAVDLYPNSSLALYKYLVNLRPNLVSRVCKYSFEFVAPVFFVDTASTFKLNLVSLNPDIGDDVNQTP